MASRFFAPAITFGQAAGPPALVDPYRLLQQGLDSMLTDIARGAGQADGNGGGDLLAGPRINVEETDTEIRLTAELPGVTEKDVQVTLDGDLLVIAGEKKQEKRKSRAICALSNARSAGFAGRSVSPSSPNRTMSRRNSGTGFSLWKCPRKQSSVSGPSRSRSLVRPTAAPRRNSRVQNRAPRPPSRISGSRNPPPRRDRRMIVYSAASRCPSRACR
ncbi:MAG TPA: Hsp20/alpha crystallin family protein [Allosphingosinicella sp.]|nr:Hsp20/alpha crystallin family protein [Allosphingosinicella sp.]